MLQHVNEYEEWYNIIAIFDAIKIKERAKKFYTNENESKFHFLKHSQRFAFIRKK